MLNRQQILGVTDAEHRDIPVPEWNGTVRLRSLTKAERDAVMAIWAGEGNSAEKMAQVGDYALVHCLVGEDAAPIFTVEDLPALKQKNGKAIDRIVKASMELNGFNDKAAEGAAKNSQAAPSGSSASGLPSPSAAPSES